MTRHPELTAAEVANTAGLHPSYLSRLQKGQVGISAQALNKLAVAISRDNLERAELVAAHLRDESCGFYPRLIQITIGKTQLPQNDLHPEIEYLQRHFSDPRIRQCVHSLVSLHRNGK